MTLINEDDSYEVKILTPKSYWVPLYYDQLQLGPLRAEVDTLLRDSPSEFVLFLTNLLGCPISLSKTTQITSRIQP